MRVDDHKAHGEWHVDWEDGICTYEDDRGIVVVEKRAHRHPFGTEYTEVLEYDQ